MHKPRLAGVFYFPMKSITLLIKDESDKTPAAVRYAKALVGSGNPPVSVFFFGRGVCQATEAIHEEWRALSRLCGVSLTLCSASAEKFRIPGDTDFAIAGLGELMAKGLEDARVISFG